MGCPHRVRSSPDRNRNLRGAVNDERMHRGKANRPPVHLSVVKSAEVGAWRGEAVEAVEATETVTEERNAGDNGE